MKLYNGQKLSLRLHAIPLIGNYTLLKVTGDLFYQEKCRGSINPHDWFVDDFLLDLLLGLKKPKSEPSKKDRADLKSYNISKEGTIEDYWITLYKGEDPEAPAELNFNLTRRSDIENGWKVDGMGKVSLFKDGRAVAVQG